MSDIIIAKYEENFLEDVNKAEGKLVLCGTVYSLRRFLPYLPQIDFFWNIQENENTQSLNIPTITFKQLMNIHDKLYILVCLNNEETFWELCDILKHTDLTAKVYNIFYNCAFNFFRGDYAYKLKKEEKPLKICLVNYEGRGWILTKFAERMNENLRNMGIMSEIKMEVDPTADINHHIPSHPYLPFADFNDTLMITHVDNQYKVELLRHQLKTARMGICMSKDTVNLLEKAGIPRHKLCYVTPAHDGNMRPKKYVIGITHRCYDNVDLRKRTNALLDIVQGLDPSFFKFKIMGAGWESIINEMRNNEIEVDYYPDFDYQLYHELMPTLDYYMFFGFDEGSMGYLDALAAGVKTIVTPQGFHLDIPGGIDHACCTVDQFATVLYDLQFEREKRIASVAELTWENYTRKHVEIWKYILGRSPLKEIYGNQLLYEDGIFSCRLSDNTVKE